MSTGGRKRKRKSNHLSLLGASSPRTNTRYWAGIDPGKNGAVVIISDDGFESAFLFRRCVYNNDWQAGELVEVLRKVADFNPTTVLEKQHAKRGQGLSSTFTTGFGYGLLIAAASCSGIEFEIFYSKKWQAVLAEEKGENSKEKALDLAYKTFPELYEFTRAKHTGLSDAACMALFARSRANEEQRDG
tara:strand:- start:5543 stop:6106 length:564 start_codon:yes stop_codon:yes gene_type:complete